MGEIDVGDIIDRRRKSDVRSSSHAPQGYYKHRCGAMFPKIVIIKMILSVDRNGSRSFIRICVHQK